MSAAPCLSDLTPAARKRVQTFVAQMVGAAEDLALLFAGHPGAAVEASLAEVRANLRADFTVRYPDATDWDALLDQFVQVARGRKAAIENQTSVGPHGAN
jgi:hypothetical protein